MYIQSRRKEENNEIKLGEWVQSDRARITEIGKEVVTAAQKQFGGLKRFPGDYAKKRTDLERFRLHRLRCEKWGKLCGRFGLAALLFFSFLKTSIDRDNAKKFESLLANLEKKRGWLLLEAKKHFDQKTVRQMFAPCLGISLY